MTNTSSWNAAVLIRMVSHNNIDTGNSLLLRQMQDRNQTSFIRALWLLDLTSGIDILVWILIWIVKRQQGQATSIHLYYCLTSCVRLNWLKFCMVIFQDIGFWCSYIKFWRGNRFLHFWCIHVLRYIISARKQQSIVFFQLFVLYNKVALHSHLLTR